MGDDASVTTTGSPGDLARPLAADDLRHPAAPATRRAALATLGAMVSGAAAWLLTGRTPAAASDAAKRRKRRAAKRKRRARKAAQAATENPLGLKPIKFRVGNPGPNTIPVEYGDYWPLRCCHRMGSQTVGIGTSAEMGTSTDNGFLWIAGRYWIDVINLPLRPPWVSAAVGGQYLATTIAFCCGESGTPVLTGRELAEGEAVDLEMDGKVFTIVREGDTNYKNYLIILPQGL